MLELATMGAEDVVVASGAGVELHEINDRQAPIDARARARDIFVISLLWMLELGEIFLRICLELGDARLATEFDLLSLVIERDRIAHGAEFVGAYDADIFGVGPDASGG
ncbi:MAG: hypothetical protein ACI8T1_001452 [Verrucomicrobiales bacterium]|jgi:hypothetical protein